MHDSNDIPGPPNVTTEPGGQHKSRKYGLRPLVKWFIVLTVAGLMSFVAVSWLVAGKLIEPANRTVAAPPPDFPVAEHRIESDSGSKIAVWHSVVESSSATIILVHGIYGNRGNMLNRAKQFRKAGYSVALIDLQAHGESPGQSITLGYLERHDVRAAVDYCRRRNPNHRIGIDAVSLGGAATLLGSPLNADAIVIESVFPTISQAVQNRISVRLGPFSHVLAPALLCQLPPRLGISTLDLRPIDKIADVGCPILIAIGDLDRHTTVEEAREMYETASSPKQLVIFNGVAHEDLYQHDPQKFADEILKFFDQYLKADTQD